MSGLDAQNRPQILEHLQKSLTVTIYDTRCVCSGAMSCRASVAVHALFMAVHSLLTPCMATVAFRWIPSSARFVALGSYARNTGCLQVYELDGADLKLVKEVEVSC